MMGPKIAFVCSSSSLLKLQAAVVYVQVSAVKLPVKDKHLK